MRILITGGTGLIGYHLIPLLHEDHDITVLTRNVAMAERIISHDVDLTSSMAQWENLDQFDAVINLAGEPIVAKRWSARQKRVIEESRWGITEQLVALCQAGEDPPAIFISGSAIGWYGRQGDEVLDETFDKPFDEFSHQLCKRWEALAMGAESQRTRVCLLRTGIVLTKRGGALGKMLPPFQLGLGGPIGNGKQYMSWIHIDDMIGGIKFLLNTPESQGVYNFTAPEPATNEAFSRALAAALNKPCFLRTPGFVMKLAMGEMADLLLYGQKVVPARLQAQGYEFQHPALADALASLKL